MNPANDPVAAAIAVDESELISLIADARAEQQRAIRSKKSLVVVSAGAGTGKTHTLARRFAWLLACDSDCRVDQILTLTFTQLAAVEMRERIKATLVEWRRRMGEKLPHLTDAIERIDEAYISTIHSFALRVVRESGLSLDVDPGASMVGEPEEREFWADFAWNLETLNVGRICMGLDEAWQTRARGLMTVPSFVDFSNYFGAAALAKLAKDAGELHGSMNARPEELWDFDPVREEELRERIAGLLAFEWREVWETWHEVVFPGIAGKLYQAKENAFVLKMRDFYEKWHLNAETNDNVLRDFYIDLVKHALGDLRGNPALKGDIEALLGCKLSDWRHKERKAHAEISETLIETPGYGEEEAASRRTLLRTAALGWACWEQARSRAGMLSFADLIRYAGYAVEADPAYGKKFRHIMIDEFQDTDGLQENLVSSLCDSWGDDRERRSLFVVGDIKQSVYRFRHADPKLFAAYIRRAEEGGEAGEHIPLSCSYRMSGRMMEGVNAVFGHIWEDGVIGGTDAPSVLCEPLKAPADASWWGVRNAYAENMPALEAILAVCDDCPEEEAVTEEAGEGRGKILVGEKRRALAHALADKLKRMIDSGTPVWDKNLPAGPDEEKFRPMRWDDIAILVPARTQYPILEETFEEKGIPALFGGGREYFNRGEVRDLVNFLRLLDRPDDDYALAGWMESPFSGLLPETGMELLSAARSAKRNLRELVAERYPEHMAALEALRRRARVAGPAAALFLLLEKPAWLAAYRRETRAKVLANIRRGVDIVREYEATFGRSLSACADYLGRAMRERAPALEASTATGASGALQVMTVHASKGLEFPVVALMGMESSVGRERGFSKAGASRALGAVAAKLPRLVPEDLSSASDEEEVASVTARWHSFVEGCEEAEEKERLLYVGMTRAQERLLCCGIASRVSGANGEEFYSSKASGAGDSWLDWFLAAGGASGNPFPMMVVDVNADDAEKEKTPGRDTGNRAADTKNPPLAVVPGDGPAVRVERLSASAYSLLAWCPFAYRMRYRQGREMTWELPDGDGYGGADMGTLAHWVLSRWDLDAASLAQYLQPEKKKNELEGYMRALPAFLKPVYTSGGVRRALFDWLSAFAAADDCAELREARASGALRSELSFRVPFEGLQLVGSIDAFWEDRDGCHIRDWKITPERSAPEEMYLNQVEFYALACHGVKPDAKADVGIVYLRPSEGRAAGKRTVVKKIDDWERLTESVGTAARIAASGPFPPSLDKCPNCPFSKQCIAKERS